MAENIEVINIKMGDVSLVPPEKISLGMVRINYEGKEYWADSAQLQQNEYQHEPFKGTVKARIESTMASLSDVYPLCYHRNKRKSVFSTWMSAPLTAGV